MLFHNIVYIYIYNIKYYFLIFVLLNMVKVSLFNKHVYYIIFIIKYKY